MRIRQEFLLSCVKALTDKGAGGLATIPRSFEDINRLVLVAPVIPRVLLLPSDGLVDECIDFAASFLFQELSIQNGRTAPILVLETFQPRPVERVQPLADINKCPSALVGGKDYRG